VNRLIASTPKAAVDLAARASLAARIEPALLRALRLEIEPRLDAAAEGDVWFSALVETRGVDGIVLRSDVLEPLRDRLKANPARLQEAWRVTERLHRRISPAVALEERIAFLATQAGVAAAEAIDAELRTALAALQVEGRRGIATWAFRALPRMPKVARGTTAAWLLAMGTARTTGKQPAMGDSPPPDLMNADLRELLPPTGDAEVGVVRNGPQLLLGEPTGHRVRAIAVPDTDPRYIEVRDGDRRRVVAVGAGETVTVTVEPGPVSLRTADYRVYDLPAEAPVRTLVLASPRAERELEQFLEGLDGRPDAFQVTRSIAATQPALEAAELILPIVSPELLLKSAAITFAAERARRGLVRLVPILFEPPADWTASGLAQFQALPRPGTSLSQRDGPTAELAVIDDLRRIAEQIQADRFNTITVDQEGSGHYRSIAEALEHCDPGATIVVKPGVYKEHLQLKRGVAIRGEDPETVVIDGGRKGCVVRMAEGARITGCTIRKSGSRSGVNDCGVMVEDCSDVVVSQNRIVENGHYGVVLRRCTCEISHNVIERNAVLGIYIDESAQFEIAFNVIADHRHSALDVTGDLPRGTFRHNTVAATESGISEGNGVAPAIDVVDNIFTDTKDGISATRAFAPRVRSNLFSRVGRPFYDWDKERTVRLPAGNIVADAQFVRGTYQLSDKSPAIGAASDGSDLGAQPFEDIGPRAAAARGTHKAARSRRVKKSAPARRVKKSTRRKKAAKKR
jgi:hypothetical protein